MMVMPLCTVEYLFYHLMLFQRTPTKGRSRFWREKVRVGAFLVPDYFTVKPCHSSITYQARYVVPFIAVIDNSRNTVYSYIPSLALCALLRGSLCSLSHHHARRDADSTSNLKTSNDHASRNGSM
jgi:hypothetical protein